MQPDVKDLTWRTLTVGSSGALHLYGEWFALRRIEEGGAIVVCPDGYVAWRHPGAENQAARATALLSDARVQILGQDAFKNEPQSPRTGRQYA